MSFKPLAVFALSGAIVTSAAFLGTSAVTQAATTAGTPTTQPQTHPKEEKHPEIRAALKGLRESKKHLEEAAHDFDGHRVAAIKAVDEAIKQCEECLQVDTK